MIVTLFQCSVKSYCIVRARPAPLGNCGPCSHKTGVPIGHYKRGNRPSACKLPPLLTVCSSRYVDGFISRFFGVQPRKNHNKNQPCFCLCLGFSQMTITRPFLLMILHFSHIGFTDGLTFISDRSFLILLSR